MIWLILHFIYPVFFYLKWNYILDLYSIKIIRRLISSEYVYKFKVCTKEYEQK